MPSLPHRKVHASLEQRFGDQALFVLGWIEACNCLHEELGTLYANAPMSLVPGLEEALVVVARSGREMAERHRPEAILDEQVNTNDPITNGPGEHSLFPGA